MRTLKITDVGPIINTATIEYKRFCILIGPQSKGKSTIAKILCTCIWIEKECCTSLTENLIKDGKEFKEKIETYHRMYNYIHLESSIIEYESPYITIKYDRGDFKISFKDNLSYPRTKLSYIPSDRNVVTMKDIEKRELEPTNFRSFLFDWLEAKRNFDPEHKASILNLGMKYYYNSNAKDRVDTLVQENNGREYEISLYDASSGIQSLVPMTVLMHYLVSDYFDNYGNDISFDQQIKHKNLANAITRYVTSKYYPDEVKEKGFRTVYREMQEKVLKDDHQAIKGIQEIEDLYNHLITPQNVSFIVEEPEQNIFPKTQVDLFNDIISLCNYSSRTSSVFITTHSPYVLAAANILLFANKLKDSPKAEEDSESLEKCIQTKSTISQSEFTAYAITGDTFKSLIDENTGLIKENELDAASEYNAEIFDRLYELYVNSNLSK